MDRVPAAVETVSGNSFSTFPGGKGANQAACVGMLGGNCIFLARSATICLEASVLTGLAEIRSCEDARTACRRLLDGE